MKNLLLVLCGLFLMDIVNAQTGLIFTVAGDGSNGYTGDGGPAIDATLNFPTAVAIDTAFNVYICDRDNHVIRKVDINQNISTFAGNGFAGISGNGGPALNAEFSAPYGIAVDKAGNVYVEDEGIRKIDIATGIITNIAGNGSSDPGDGGPATNAILESGHQFAFDTAGNLFITDALHASIRRVDAVTGIITTVAGNGTQGCSGDFGPATSAELRMPQGLAIDKAGNLFIADFQSNNIRRVDAQTQIITTICGDPAGIDGGYSGDGGPAKQAMLQGPDGLTFDGTGNLFVCDNMNGAIRKINTSGIITTIAGRQDNGLQRMDSDGVPATLDFLRNPEGIAFDKDGDLYLAESENMKVRRIILSDNISAVQPLAGDIRLSSYPNPAHNLLQVESADFKNAGVSASVYDVAGQLISVTNTITGDKMQFNTGNLAPGMYFINVVTHTGTGTVKFVKE